MNIKLYISCHKLSEIPKENIFYPIQVGTGISGRKAFPNMLHDNVGENISSKNHMYCELTAQYWAWKNDTADYYGFFHYRRLISFSNDLFSLDERNQIVSPLICRETLSRYCLNDSEYISKIIKENDIITGLPFNIRKINTPRGKQKNVYMHWKAHDLDLIEIKSVDAIMCLIKKKYPEIYPYAEKYLYGKFFLGYNCFIMKKDLFKEFCEFEFAILDEFETLINHDEYNDTLNRTCGFMGEILYSIFVYYVKSTRDIKIKELPLVYFDETSPNIELIPDINNDICPIVLKVNDENFFQSLTALKSLFNNISLNDEYEIIILNDGLSSHNVEKLKLLLNSKTNIFFKILNLKKLLNYFYIKHKVDSIDLSNYIKLFLPWLFDQYSSILFLDSNIFIRSDIKELCNMPILNGKSVGAIKDIEISVKLRMNLIDKNNIKLNNTNKYFNDKILRFNFTKIREELEVKKVISLISSNKIISNEQNILNIIYEDNVKYLPYEWGIKLKTNEIDELLIKGAISIELREYEVGEKNPKILYYNRIGDLFNNTNYEFSNEFWKVAKEIEVYELFLNKVINAKKKSYSKFFSEKIINNFAPKGTLRRKIGKRLIPRNGFVWNKLKKFYLILIK